MKYIQTTWSNVGLTTRLSFAPHDWTTRVSSLMRLHLMASRLGCLFSINKSALALLASVILLAWPMGAAAEEAEMQADTTTTTAQYFDINYNFLVSSDTLMLLKNQPEELLNAMPTDSLSVFKGERIVVADFKVMPTDSIDTLWVAVARDQYTMGWTRYSVLMKSTVPDDPISQFINLFSSTHLFVSIILFVLAISLIALRKIDRKRYNLIHINDIRSLYPTVFVIIVAIAAALYGSIQLFARDEWQQFYFHPTLNPFHQPWLLKLFLTSIWMMIIGFLATADDVFHTLPQLQAWIYMIGLLAVCAILYIVFSITTQYYVGFALLAIYIVYAIAVYVWPDKFRLRI